MERARDVYDIVIEPASRWRRIWGPIAVLAANVPFYGQGPSNPGGRKARIVDRRTGETVAEIDELFGDDVGPIPTLVDDHETKDVATFAAVWLGDRRSDEESTPEGD